MLIAFQKFEQQFFSFIDNTWFDLQSQLEKWDQADKIQVILSREITCPFTNNILKTVIQEIENCEIIPYPL